jgi:uncharacterized protein YeaO (DUF488 family)
MEIDAIEQRPGDTRLIIGGTARRAAAGAAGVAQITAFAGVHRRDELDPRGKGNVAVGARHRDLAGLQRLAQRIEHRALEFGQFVEKQHAEMREADLARANLEPAAHQRRHRGRVMRRAERPCARQAAILEQPRHAGDHRDFERFRHYVANAPRR